MRVRRGLVVEVLHGRVYADGASLRRVLWVWLIWRLGL